MYRASLCVALALGAGPVCAEELYTTWSDGVDVFVREIATGEVTNVTERWPWAAWEPDVGGGMVIFQTPNGSLPAIYAVELLWGAVRFPLGGTPFPIWISAMDGAPVSDPQIGCLEIGSPGVDWKYWIAWKMRGGTWALPVSGLLTQDRVFEVLPGYTGPIDIVDGSTLVYDGGRLDLGDPTRPPAPEPSTLALSILAAIVLLSWKVHFKRIATITTGRRDTSPDPAI
jgi:hypothetical protein